MAGFCFFGDLRRIALGAQLDSLLRVIQLKIVRLVFTNAADLGAYLEMLLNLGRRRQYKGWRQIKTVTGR